MKAATSVLVSPVLLDIITAYQLGCCLDMRVFVRLASPLKNIEEFLMPRFWWSNDLRIRLEPFAKFDQVVMAWYAEVGLSRLKKLFACLRYTRDDVVAHAAYTGNLSVLARLPGDVIRAVEVPLLDLAASKGHMNVVKYLHADVGHNGCTTMAVDCAAFHGHLNIVAYLLANRREGCSVRGVEGAARNGHLDIVKLFHAHYAYQPHDFFHSALEAAASHNQLAIVLYIMDLFGPAARYSTKVMDETAATGHLEMVQFLHERNFHCTMHAMDWAAANGHLDVVKWLHENRTEGCTTDAMDDAADQGHLEVVQWLHEHRQEGCTSLALLAALASRQWVILLLLATHCDVDDVERTLKDAVEDGCAPLDVVTKLKSILKSKP